MQGNLISFARCHQGIVDNPPMLAHPWTPLRFHAFLDLIHRQMRGRSGDSMPHVGSSFPSICVFSSSLLFYHIEGELVSYSLRVLAALSIEACNPCISENGSSSSSINTRCRRMLYSKAWDCR